jgi:hypothetical protein
MESTRTIRGDWNVLGASLILLAVLLMGGSWWNKRNQELSRELKLKASAGHYQSVRDPALVYELKEDGQWFSPGNKDRDEIRGNYTIEENRDMGEVIYFTSPNSPFYTGRFVKDGFMFNTGEHFFKKIR